MYCDDSEDASKHFGHAIHDFIMLIWCKQSLRGGGGGVLVGLRKENSNFDYATAAAL